MRMDAVAFRIIVWDKGLWAKDFMGQITVPLASFVDSDKETRTMPLEPRRGLPDRVWHTLTL